MSSILLIQSDASARADLCHLIAAESDLAVYAEVETLAAARAEIAHRVPDLIVADLRFTDGPLVNLLDELRPGRSHVLVLTASLRDPHLMHTLRHGAEAYQVAGRPPQNLLKLIRSVLAGESPMAPEIARNVQTYFHALNSRPIAAGTKGPAPLSGTEQRLLQWISEGYLTQEIARGLGVTAQQVGLMVRGLYRKMQDDLRTRQQSLRGH